MISRCFGGGLAVFLCFVPAQTFAQSAPPSPRDEHGGLRLRLAVGPALQLFQQTQRVIGGKIETSVSGAALDGHALVGWAFSGLVLGAGVSSAMLPPDQAIRLKHGTNPAAGDFSEGTETIGLTPSWTRATTFGVFGGFYPDPAGGFYAQGLVGYASLPSFKGSSQARGYSGVGLSGAVGYEWSIAPSWGAGILGQVQLLGLKGEGSAGNGNDDISATMALFSLLGTITFR